MQLNDTNRSGNICVSKTGLTAGTTTTYTTGATCVFSVKGTMYSKSAVTNGATPTTDANTGVAFVPLTAGKSCLFLFGFTAGGTVKVAQGPVVNTDDVTNKLAALQFPVFGDDVCAFGYLKAQAGSTLSGSWTFGSSNLSGVTGMTYTFADLLAIPAAPLAA